MSEAAVAGLDATLAALADPHRRRAVYLLGRRPQRAGELSKALGLAPAAMSKHLRVLRHSGLVEETHPRFDARVRIYSLRAGALDSLKQWLRDTEDAWAEQLASFKEHLESAAADAGTARTVS